MWYFTNFFDPENYFFHLKGSACSKTLENIALIHRNGFYIKHLDAVAGLCR